MYNANTPPLEELPSSRALVRSTLIAAATAVVLLVAVVLPAEYAVDPTGIGRVLGLTQMGEVKMALAEEAAAAEAAEAAALAGDSVPGASPSVVATDSASAPPTSGAEPATRADSVSITLTPGEGAEIKLAMDEGASVNYRWSVEGGVVNHDTHGDILNPPAGFYHGYSRGTAMESDEGVLVAAFDGTHGWFWRNRGSGEVTVTLRVNGEFQEMRRLE